MTFRRDLLEGLRISWSAIRANTLRSGLTTLGIIIGVVTVTLMGSAIAGLNDAFLRSISILGTDVLYIQKYAWFSDEEWWRARNRRDLGLELGRAIARQSTTALAVSLESEMLCNVRTEDRSASGVWLAGNSEDSGLVRGLNLVQGRFLSASDVWGYRPVCVLGNTVAESFFPNQSPIGKRLRLDGINYEVIGVIGKMGQFFTGFNLDNQVIIPITRMISDFRFEPDIGIMVKVRDITAMDEAREELRGLMRQLRRLPPGARDDFAINEQQAFVKTFQRVAGTIALVGLFVTSLSLFVGGIGIMNIMFVSVAERTREIGIRKALGARRRSILVQFLLEAAMICLLGGCVGVGLAALCTILVSKILPTSLPVSIVVTALSVSLLTGVISGFFPAWRAARMNPVDALRAE